MKKLYILSILAVALVIIVTSFYTSKEGFSGLYDLDTPGSIPEQPILDDYPLIRKNETSNKNYSDIWWEYPIFKLGSFKQITNNLKYRDNPDEGTCIRSDFCNAFYKNKQDKKSNIITPLAPAEEGVGARVGYFRTNPNELYFSIPTNENILY